MTDLRNLTILGLMGRINTFLDAGEAAAGSGIGGRQPGTSTARPCGKAVSARAVTTRKAETATADGAVAGEGVGAASGPASTNQTPCQVTSRAGLFLGNGRFW
jgi:hypothetical protein